ncbi:hypothetical protein HanIR_Chr17g0861831 [Helianthus annuus]|nr:hypothetical protein HanIR_Chr17g0861831 [Helianthus annuus]
MLLLPIAYGNTKLRHIFLQVLYFFIMAIRNGHYRGVKGFDNAHSTIPLDVIRAFLE